MVSIALLNAYRKARTPIHSESYPTRVFFTSAKQAIVQARYTLHEESVDHEWQSMGGREIDEDDAKREDEEFALENPVRIVAMPDMWNGWEDLEGDCYDPSVNPDIHPRILKRQQDEFREMVQSEGVWGYRAEFFDGEDWQETDSAYSFAGFNTFDGSGYDTELKQSAMNAYAKHIENAHTAFAETLESSRPDMYPGMT